MIREPRSSAPPALDPSQAKASLISNLRAALELFLALVVMNLIAFLGWGGGGKMLAVLVVLVVGWSRRAEHIRWGFIALVLGLSTFDSLSEAVEQRRFLKQDMTAQQIRIEQAPHYASATLYSFRDGAVQTEYTYVHDVEQQLKRRTKRKHVYVAPLVPDGWDKSREIPAWVVAVDGEDEIAGWRQPYRQAVRVNETTWPLSTARQAVAQACTHHALSSKAGAPLLHWRHDPQANVERKYQQALTRTTLATTGCCLLFLLWTSILTGIRVIRSKR